jgi:arylsulfatase A-like enzyme
MADRPNLLFFLSDQHRHDWLGSNPDLPIETPNLDRLAGRGVTFTDAFCPSPLCGPSRAGLASGREYGRCGVPDNGVDYPVDEPTYYRRLRDDAGYHVATCGKLDLHKDTFEWGPEGSHALDELGFSTGVDNADRTLGYTVAGADSPSAWTDREPYLRFLHEEGLLDRHLEDYARRRETGEYRGTFPTPLPEYAYCDNWVTRNGLEMLSEAPREEPWHLVVNFTDPHQPMDVTERMYHQYRDGSPRTFPEPVDPDDRLSSAEHAAVRRNYAAKVTNVDRSIGRFLDALREREELSNTVVVYASDHGELLGDHGLWKKGEPYHPSVKVPLLVAGPGVDARGRVDALTSLIDVAATLLAYGGLEVPESWDARPLQSVLSGRQSTHRDHVRSGLGSWRMAFDGRYKLITGWDRLDGDPVLFDLDGDPTERENVASRHPAVVERLSRVIERPAEG